MKKTLFFTLFVVCMANGQVLIDDNKNSDETPHPKAVLELRSSSKGLLLPRVENTGAITSPEEGMIVFDKSNHTFRGYNGSDWIVLSPPVSSTSTVSNVDFTGDLIIGQELQGTYTYSGDTEEGSVYTWNSAVDNQGAGRAEIVVAKNYTLTSNEAGKYIQFCVLSANSNGISGNSVCSAWKGPVQDRGGILLSETFEDVKPEPKTFIEWKGNDNFPIVKKVFPDEKSIKIGSEKYKGSITSKKLNFGGKNITISLSLKNHSNKRSTTKVKVGKSSRTIKDYLSDKYTTKVVKFDDVEGEGTVIIETVESKKEDNRVYISNVTITKE